MLIRLFVFMLVLLCFCVATEFSVKKRFFIQSVIGFRLSVRPSVCLSRRSTAAAACGWFAAEREHLQRTSIDTTAAGAGAQQQMRVASCREPRTRIDTDVLREEVPPVNASHGSFENPLGRFVLRSFRQGGGAFRRRGDGGGWRAGRPC